MTTGNQPNNLEAVTQAIAALQQSFATLPPEQLPAAAARLNELLAQKAALVGDGTLVQGNDNEVVGSRGVKADDVGGSIVTGDNNSVTHIYHTYQQAPGRPFLNETEFTQALGRYLSWVERRYGRLDLRGVEKREQQVLSLTLDDVYVSLAAAVSPVRKKQRHLLEKPPIKRQKPVNMHRLLGLGSSLVIVGGPGCGKTTYLRLIAASVTRALRLNQPELAQNALGLAEPLPLPVVVSLSEYNRYRRRHSQPDDPRQGTLITFISHSLIRQSAAIGLPDDFFERLLVQGHSCLLLLDGLDEVANERERNLVRRAVEELAFNDGVRQIVVTSRSRAYQGEAVLPEEFRVATVQPMTPEQVNALALRWCRAVYEPEDALTEAKRLQDAIAGLERHRAARGEARLAETPLLVTIIAIVHYNQRRLPDQRAELYEKCVEVLLTEGHHSASDATYELADWGGTLPEKRGLLAYLAFEMMQAGEAAGRSVSEWQLRTWLRPRLARRYGEEEANRQLDSFTQAMRERGSLLDERGREYQFTHLTFQEFLCAYYLAETVREPVKIVAFLREERRLSEAWWREVVLLTAGYLALKSTETVLAFLEALNGLKPDDSLALAAAELAGTTLQELDSQGSNLNQKVAERLVALLTDKTVQAEPALRMLAGDALGRLGDPRPGVCTPEPDLIPIPAGVFLMGEGKLYEIEIAQPFAIGRYPITNAQYQLFVDDGGYTEKWRRCWTTEGWQWKDNLSGPRDYDGFTLPNQPRVGVSWYEAVAYVRWLAETTGKPYRLPTEAEWERAARHTDGHTYPWGEDWQDGTINTREAGLRRTTVVGIFPLDTAVCGAHDLGGNVAEWCQTRRRNEQGEDYTLPYKHDDGRENLEGGDNIFRENRGGLWGSGKKWSRCGARGGGNPYHARWVFGFRVVVSPFFDSAL